MRPLNSSYRDNDGFVFEQDGTIFRYIHPRFFQHYNLLMQGGLYNELTAKQWLVTHKELDEVSRFGFTEGKIILPLQVPFISYPYEWGFTMWQDAALLTLNIAAAALKKGLFLKDATPFNIQFLKGRPIFIDTISFECYTEGEPWVAYRQFCECFLAPLLLMRYCHQDCYKLFSVYPNGLPLDVLASLLPQKAKWNANVFLHIYLNARISGGPEKKSPQKTIFSRQKHAILLEGLIGMVRKLSPAKIKTTWDDYYTGGILGDGYLKAKTNLVQVFLQQIEFEKIIDLGANDGYFSLLFKNTNKQIIAIDGDANCINDLYLTLKEQKITNILPLVNTLHNPSPAIGWGNKERDPLIGRLHADLLLALALIHHLAITFNIPIPLIADWLEPMGKYLLIEFVPKTDEKVQLLLQNREDVFDDYTVAGFELVFAKKFKTLLREKIAGTERILYLMKRMNETT